MGTLNLPTMQAVFDHVCAHLFRQGRRAWGHVEKGWTTEGGCAYHAADGAKCAVGCLIDSARYRKEFEGKSLKGDPMEVRPIYDAVSESIGRALTILEESLLQRLQEAHDHGGRNASGEENALSPREAWALVLPEIAREFGLTFNPPVDVKA